MSQPNRCRVPPSLRFVAALGLVAATAGCGGQTIGTVGTTVIATDGDGDGASGGVVPRNLAFATTTTTMAGTTTTSTVPTTTATTASTVPTTLAPTTTTLPPFPSSTAALIHGGQVWAVVLVGSPAFDDPRLDLAVAAAADAGYHTGWTDCDDGAATALGLAPVESVFTVSVYFAVEADARAAAAAFGARGTDAAVGLVTTYCLD